MTKYDAELKVRILGEIKEHLENAPSDEAADTINQMLRDAKNELANATNNSVDVDDWNC